MLEHAQPKGERARLSETLIENALALTGKSMEDMEVVSGVIYQQEELTYRFSIEKFCYYLLSPEFVEKYYKNMYPNEEIYTYSNFFHGLTERFGIAIYEYQLNNQEPLQELLSKIGNQ